MTIQTEKQHPQIYPCLSHSLPLVGLDISRFFSPLNYREETAGPSTQPSESLDSLFLYRNIFSLLPHPHLSLLFSFLFFCFFLLAAVFYESLGFFNLGFCREGEKSIKFKLFNTSPNMVTPPISCTFSFSLSSELSSQSGGSDFSGPALEVLTVQYCMLKYQAEVCTYPKWLFVFVEVRLCRCLRLHSSMLTIPCA